ncbi:hypothetical protein [Streptomyces sp. NPDC127092]|uniref:hypothetical protein n=1 Tax=Streptomyces sp. NPDC127092 TaxID=3347135 RepID=UPI003650CE19
MRSDLRRLSAVSLVTALTLGAAAGPAFAEDAPAASPVGIGRALTNDAERGSFQVTAWTDAPQATVTAVSAKVRQGDTVLADIPALVESQSYKGTFSVPAEATLKLVEDQGSIPELGKYAIDVTATDSLGNTVTRTDAGTLDFTLKPRLKDFHLGTPSWADPYLRPQGKLVGIQPGSGDEVVIPEAKVSYQRGGPDGETVGSADTTVTGEFAGAPVELATRYEHFYATYSGDTAKVHGSTFQYGSPAADLKAKWMRLQVTADKTRATNGETVTLTGRLTDPENAEAPLPNEPLKAQLGGGLSKTVLTDAEGKFTVQLVAAPSRDSSGWTVSSGSWFQGISTVSGPLVMPLDSRTSVVGYKLGTDARLTVYGEFRSPYESWSGTSSQQTVILEQSPDGQTGWKKVASTSFYSNIRNPFVIGTWSKGGWFRLRHLESDQYAESVSKPFYVVRTETRVTGLKASPDPVAKGSTITVTGSLQQYTSGAWRGLGSQSVSIWYKKWGTTTWKQVASGKSSSTGAVSLKTTATADGWYQIRYYGDGTHFQTFSGQDWVDVR